MEGGKEEQNAGQSNDQNLSQGNPIKLFNRNKKMANIRFVEDESLASDFDRR